MRTVLIATYTHPVALGMRYVSSCLKSAGHEVRMIFMASKRDTAKPSFPPAVIESLIEHCRDADLVGMGLLTNSFYRACFLTEALRRAGVKVPIIWGGTHAPVAPDECLEYADVVCIGEGERVMLQLAERMDHGLDPTDLGGLAFRAGGPFGNRSEVRNPVGPLIENLDDLPFPDYELRSHWVADDGRLVPARPENLRGALDRLRVETTRGCPYRCTFCNNTTWANIYRGKGSWVRRRSIENVLCEIEEMCCRFPGISSVNIVDDLFFVRPAEEIAAFAEGYIRRVGRPLEIDAHPELVTEDRIAVLSRMPITLVSMGIQSGSSDTLYNIYHRRTPLDRIAGAMDLLHRYRLPVEYHYIVNNPYESDANIIETMRFVADHHRKAAALRIFPLALFPGSPLYERARTDGIIRARHEDAYRRTYAGSVHVFKLDYLAIMLRLVLHLRNLGAPPWLTHRFISLVTNRFVRRCLDHRICMSMLMGTYYLCWKLYKIVLYQPIVRPLLRLRRWWALRKPAPKMDLALREPMSVPQAAVRDSESPPGGLDPEVQGVEHKTEPQGQETASSRRSVSHQAASKTMQSVF
ncbi:MAG: B12-binding domain-containing radical SAM protein [Phycisphaerae bacterium]